MKGALFSVAIALLIIASSTDAQEKMKLMTPEIGGEYGVGDKGHTDLRFGLRFNIPSAENLILGFCVQGGSLMHDTDDLFYIDEYSNVYDEVEDWTDFSYDIFAGWEFSPQGKTNPYLLFGVGFVKYGFTARDSYTNNSLDLSIEGSGTKVPIVLGCDFKLGENFALSPYIKLTAYTKDMEVEIADYEDGLYVGSHLENLNEWRGLAHFGLNLAFPIRVNKPKDSDGDGVWDDFDLCPDTPLGTPVDERGCPKAERRTVEVVDVEKEFRDKGVFVTNQVFFEFNSDEITAESFPLLDEVGRILKSNPDWRIEIAGHTDSIGTEDYNSKLSLRRSKSVKNYLVKNFDLISENLSARGYGESQPIADNGTNEGRAANRRVEFKIIR